MSRPRYIHNMTFPRSGHHLLVNCLRDYLKEHLRYCEIYGHCRRSPCTNTRTNWQKNHDFSLSLPMSTSNYYVVQYRNPIESIASWYLWELEWGIRAEDNGRFIARMLRKVPNWSQMVLILFPDTEARWRKYLLEKLEFWRDFAHKWVIHKDNTNVYLLPYHRFIFQGEEELANVIQFAWPGIQVDQKKLEKSFNNTNSFAAREY